MLYDLNIAWSPSTRQADIDRTLRFSASLGYDVVALDHTISPPYPKVDAAGVALANPIPIFSPPRPSSAPASVSDASLQPARRYPAAILRRATLIIDESGGSDKSGGSSAPVSIPPRLLSSLAAEYDLVALRPIGERALSACCLTLAEPGQIVSLDLAAPMAFHLRPRPLMAAVARGVRFEVCYAQALASVSPAATASAAQTGMTSSSQLTREEAARRRANFVANLASLVRATRGGRGLVISSGGGAGGVGPLLLRAPADVMNLLAVWGLPTDKGREALDVNPRAVLVNEGMRRGGFRGIVRVLEAPEKAKPAVNPEEGKKKVKKGRAAAQTPWGADKPDKAEAGEPNAGSEVLGEGEAGPSGGHSLKRKVNAPPMSKRQAKKLRLAVQQAGGETETNS